MPNFQVSFFLIGKHRRLKLLETENVIKVGFWNPWELRMAHSWRYHFDVHHLLAIRYLVLLSNLKSEPKNLKVEYNLKTFCGYNLFSDVSTLSLIKNGNMICLSYCNWDVYHPDGSIFCRNIICTVIVLCRTLSYVTIHVYIMVSLLSST